MVPWMQQADTDKGRTRNGSSSKRAVSSSRPSSSGLATDGRSSRMVSSSSRLSTAHSGLDPKPSSFSRTAVKGTRDDPLRSFEFLSIRKWRGRFLYKKVNVKWIKRQLFMDKNTKHHLAVVNFCELMLPTSSAVLSSSPVQVFVLSSLCCHIVLIKTNWWVFISNRPATVIGKSGLCDEPWCILHVIRTKLI